MKYVNLILTIGAILISILVFRTVVVSAQGGGELKPDITAPGVTNGWYTGDVQVTWPIPPEATVVNGCEETVIDFDTPGVELSCDVKTEEGTLSGSVVIKRDATPPTVLIDPAGLYFEVNEGDTLLLDAASSTDETSGVATITWDLLELDGAIAVNGNPVDSQNMDDNHFKNPADILVVDGPGKAEFSVQVADLAGNNVSVVVIAILTNVAPEISEVILSAETIPVGTSVKATTVFTDSGVLDTHTATIDWGDGAVDEAAVVEQGGSGIVTGAHAFTEVSGLGYPIVVTVTDKDNGSSTSSTNVSVHADLLEKVYLPVVVLAKDEIPWEITASLSAETIHLGGTVVATAVFTPLNSLDNYAVAIDWGDGTVEDGITIEGNGFTGAHLYDDPGQYEVVVIVIMPDEEQTKASTTLNVMSAQETIDWLIEHVDTLVHDAGLTSDQGQSLTNQLEAAQIALAKEQTEAAVEALEAYLNDLTEYIDAGLVPKEDPSPTVVDDMANVLLADPRPSPND